ncbi:pentatricopeptide repeat-containing protein, partial [Trifolium medium]|nr:pentatricopeptide repeat-containing protein [Trifolium medium]
SQMGSRGLVPDSYLLPSAIKACAVLKALKPGRQVHAFASVNGFGSDSVLMSSLVHMYLKCNRIEDAQKLFDGMCERDVIVWSAMIAGYSRLGIVDRAKELFNEM